eukprot:scaffold398115_cov18-Prasinocladus_malaysianus.AAC.1
MRTTFNCCSTIPISRTGSPIHYTWQSLKLRPPCFFYIGWRHPVGEKIVQWQPLPSEGLFALHQHNKEPGTHNMKLLKGLLGVGSDTSLTTSVPLALSLWHLDSWKQIEKPALIAAPESSGGAKL